MSAPSTAASRAQLHHLRRVRDRLEPGLCLVEGPRLLAEALRAGRAPRLVAAEAALLEEPVVVRAGQAGAELVRVSPADAQRVSDRRHAPGLLAAVDEPPAWKPDLAPTGSALVLGLCGLQDPGNVGTLLRSALAFGAAGCLLAEGCADPFAPKVLRASAGAALFVPVGRTGVADLPRFAQQHGLTALGASATGASGQPGTGANLPARCLLLLGHETRGLPDLPGVRLVGVPHEATVDSLNVAVAGSILMRDWFEARRA